MTPATSFLARKVARWHIARANSARDRRKWVQAQSSYSRALALTPARSDIWVQLGHAEKESGALELAAGAYARAIAIAPHVADTHLQIGHLRKLQGDLDAAAESYAKALQIDPTLGHAVAELLALGRTPPKTDVERIADLEAALSSTRDVAAQEADKMSDLREAVENLRGALTAQQAQAAAVELMMADLRAEFVQLQSRVDTLAQQSSVAAEFGIELSNTRAIVGKVFERLATAEHALAALRDEGETPPIRSAA